MLWLQSCYWPQLAELCEEGVGNVDTIELEVPAFHALELATFAEVTAWPSDTLEVQAVGQPNIVGLLGLDVYDATWRIAFDALCVHDYALGLLIRLPQMRKVRVSSSGAVVFADTFHLDLPFEFGLSGSGNLLARVDAPAVRGRIQGNGHASLAGHTRLLELQISGAGSLSAFDLSAEVAHLTISGKGFAEVYATDTLRVEIVGSGFVRYKGEPVVEAEISGTGKLIKW